MDTIGWGVLGPGRIARQLATDLLLVPEGRLVATGSRDEQRAADFAAEFGGRAHGSYEELVADPEVDVVYVATPHVLHDENTRLALEAGKAVLCEKPMTLDAATTTALFAEASERGLFLMEAMWMACHPTIRTLLRLLAERRLRDAPTGPRLDRVRGARRDGRRRADRPAARPGTRRRGAARHGHLPTDLRPPRARRARRSSRPSRTSRRRASTSTSPSPGSIPRVRPRR